MAHFLFNLSPVSLRVCNWSSISLYDCDTDNLTKTERKHPDQIHTGGYQGKWIHMGKQLTQINITMSKRKSKTKRIEHSNIRLSK